MISSGNIYLIIVTTLYSISGILTLSIKNKKVSTILGIATLIFASLLLVSVIIYSAVGFSE